MGKLVKFAIRDEILANTEKIGLCKKFSNVFFGSSSVYLTESKLPCIVIDQLSDVALSVNAMDILTIKLCFIQNAKQEDYELMFENLKDLFKNNKTIDYIYKGIVYSNIVGYQQGSDFFDGTTSIINGKQIKYLQFVVVSPKF